MRFYISLSLFLFQFNYYIYIYNFACVSFLYLALCWLWVYYFFFCSCWKENIYIYFCFLACSVHLNCDLYIYKNIVIVCVREKIERENKREKQVWLKQGVVLSRFQSRIISLFPLCYRFISFSHTLISNLLLYILSQWSYCILHPRQYCVCFWCSLYHYFIITRFNRISRIFNLNCVFQIDFVL